MKKIAVLILCLMYTTLLFSCTSIDQSKKLEVTITTVDSINEKVRYDKDKYYPCNSFPSRGYEPMYKAIWNQSSITLKISFVFNDQNYKVPNIEYFKISHYKDETDKKDLYITKDKLTQENSMFIFTIDDFTEEYMNIDFLEICFENDLCIKVNRVEPNYFMAQRITGIRFIEPRTFVIIRSCNIVSENIKTTSVLRGFYNIGYYKRFNINKNEEITFAFSFFNISCSYIKEIYFNINNLVIQKDWINITTDSKFVFKHQYTNALYEEIWIDHLVLNNDEVIYPYQSQQEMFGVDDFKQGFIINYTS